MNQEDIELSIVNQVGRIKSLEVEWLTINETCKYLRIGRGSVYSMIEEGVIDSAPLIVKKGNTKGIRLINLESVRKYVKMLVDEEKAKKAKETNRE